MSSTRRAGVPGAVCALLVGCAQAMGPADGGSAGKLSVTAPFAPFSSQGDLWMSTWADNDDVFVSWGDGVGPFADGGVLPKSTHNGLAALHGAFPNVTYAVVNRAMPFSEDATNSKPSGLLFVGGTLYVAIHRPLLHPEFGFIASSSDLGQTFQFPQGGDTWTKPSKFVCRMFLNMGKGYSLNTDGFVYVYGIGSEIDWRSMGGGRIYLARVPTAKVLDTSAWEYFAGLDAQQQPTWGATEASARELSGATSDMLFSVVFHPGLGEYLLLTAETVSGHLYRADHPWGPWTSVGTWFSAGSSWDQTYMPSIVTKDLTESAFFFVSGGVQEQGAKAESRYRLRIGSMTVPR